MAQDVVKISVLGRIGIEGSSSTEAFGPRLRRLLAGLVIARGGVVSESTLVDIIWPEGNRLPANPVASLQTYVSRLRGHLGSDAIETVAPGYRLRRDALSIDCVQFEKQLALADGAQEQADDRTAISALEAALAFWEGPAFDEFAEESWAVAEAHRLNELRLDALERRVELLIGLGDVDGRVIAELEQMSLEHPHREAPTRLLMTALYLVGRQPDALSAFSRYRARLATDLGLEPSAGLRELEEKILLDEPSTAGGLTKSRTLRAYTIEERLGEGAFSLVYRGTQPSVGREVAIKQIRAELANRPEFIRRFETEAHLVARLEHPHIVPLIDYWREPGSAYLVMRLLRGGSLEHAVHKGPWDLARTMRMVEQIGAALAVAHRAGIVHRDVKPANILLDEEGNAYLTDFGIALEATAAVDVDASLSAGSPAYASPEQLRREPVGPPADVHGLAIAVYEALTGRLPFPDERTQAALLQRQLHDPIPSVRSVRPEVPSVVDGVLSRATRKDPEERIATVEEFVDLLRDAVGTNGAPSEGRRAGVGTVLSIETRNPYKGLMAFDEVDSRDFAGRVRLVDQLVATLAAHRLVAVVGPSGSGKSSVTRAGLLPAVRHGAIEGSDEWFITTLLPGANPFEELEVALLRVASETPSDLLGVMTSGPRGIARAIRHALPADGDQVLLVIDQFEELFTLAEPSETADFLEGLAVAVSEERSRLRVVLTLRADFYDRPLLHEGIGRLVKEGTVAVLPLAPDEIEHAIVDPAHSVGAEFEPGLVSEIVADVADQPGALPLLQYALTELYERRVSGLLTRDAYRALGGVSGALGRRAEALYAALNSGQQAAIRRIFGRLVSPGVDGIDARRRATRGEFGRDPEIEAVLQLLGDARLLLFDRDPQSREPTVEVAHEALLREWPRLRGWLAEDREEILIQRHLHGAADEWDSSGRPDGELYRGGRLESAETWAAEHAGELSGVEVAFLEAARAQRDREAAKELRTARRLRRLATAAVVVAVVAAIAGLIAWQQRSRATEQAELAERGRADAEAAGAFAEEQRARAESSRMAGEARLVAEGQRELGLLLAAEVYRRGETAEALSALQQVLIDIGPFLGNLGGGTAFQGSTWLDEDRILAVGSGGAEVVNVDDGARRALIDESVFTRDNRNSSYDDAPLPVYLVEPSAVAFVPASDPRGIRVVDLDSGEETARFRAPDSPVPLEWLASDGDHLAALDAAGELFLFDRASESLLWSASAVPEVLFGDFDLPEGFAVFATLPAQNVHTWAIPVVFSADGSSVEVHTTTLRRFDVATGRAEETVLGTASDNGPRIAPLPYQAIPSPDGETVLTRAGSFLQLRGRDSVDYLAVARVAATSNSVRGAIMEWVAWNGGETAVALLSDRRLVVVGLVDGATVGSPVSTGLLGAHHVSISLDGRTAAVAHRSGVALFSLDGRRPLARSMPVGETYGSGISINGELLIQGFPNLTANDARSDDLHDVATGALVDPPAPGPRFRFPVGADLLIADNGAISPNEIAIFDADSLEPLGTFEFQDSGTLDVEVSIQAQAVVATTWFKGVLAFDLESGEQVATLVEAGDQARSPVFSADGEQFAVIDRDGVPTFWRTADWTLEAEGFAGTAAPVVALRYHPNGRQLVSLSRDGEISLWDTATRKLVRSFSTTARLDTPDGSLAFDRSGRFVLALAGPSATLWDLELGEQIGRAFPNDDNNIIAVQDGDGAPQLVTAESGSRLIWDLRVDRWYEIACDLAGRNLTRDEWDQFGPDGEPYAVTCPSWPAGS